jgi:hypothetical protein
VENVNTTRYENSNTDVKTKHNQPLEDDAITMKCGQIYENYVDCEYNFGSRIQRFNTANTKSN